MSSSSVSRTGTANLYSNTIASLSQRQKELSSQMEHTTAGKRVLRASDDPVSAAQAERARTRLSRLENDQRALDAQRTAITDGEAALGEIMDALQEFRSLMISAGNGSYSQTQFDAIAHQLSSLKEQVVSFANRQDSNGLPIFRGLNSESPLIQGDNNFSGLFGQKANGEYGIASSLDGGYAFMSVPTGNGVLNVAAKDTNAGTAWTDVGTITSPNAAAAFAADVLNSTSSPMEIVFTVDSGSITYAVNGGSDNAYTPGQSIEAAGMAIVFSGIPVDGDTFIISPSEKTNIFTIMQESIDNIKNINNGNIPMEQANRQLQAQIDAAMNRVSSTRSYAGDLLNQADRREKTMLAQSETAETIRSNAEDIDMVKALTDLKTMETGVSAALQSYASIQKLSLFNYIS